MGEARVGGRWEGHEGQRDKVGCQGQHGLMRGGEEEVLVVPLSRYFPPVMVTWRRKGSLRRDQS